MTKNPKDYKNELSVKDTRKYIEKLLQDLFSVNISNLEYKNNAGRNNVFRVQTDTLGNLIVRLTDDTTRLDSFKKEKWCAERAIEAGVPTPKILAVGEAPGHFVYSIVEEAKGLNAMDYTGNKSKVWYQVGQILKVVNSIDTQGFGLNFNWRSKHDTGFGQWREYLNGYDIRIDRVLELYEAHASLSKKSLDKLSYFIEKIKNWQVFPKLAHFDIALRNILVDQEGTITAVIDWELSRSLPAPYGDFSQTLHFLSETNEQNYFEELVSGYGLTKQEYKSMHEEIEAYLLVRQANHLNFLVNKQRIQKATDAFIKTIRKYSICKAK